jgi:hypothetical protein
MPGLPQVNNMFIAISHGQHRATLKRFYKDEREDFIMNLQEKLLSVFLIFALIGWLAGMTSLQLHEASLKREIAAAKIAEEKAQAEKLVILNQKWSASKFAKWESFGNFSFM